MAPLTAAPLRRAFFASFSQQAKPRSIRQISTRTINARQTRAQYIPPQQQQRRAISADTSPPATTTTWSIDEVPSTQTAEAETGSTSVPIRSATPAPKPPTAQFSQALLSTLPLLQLQSAHPDGTALYATLHIHNKPYLVTLGDKVRLPFRMPNVQPGDILRLTHASTLGTRDYTLTGAPWVDARCFEARAVVAGVESEPMRVMEKTKRRVRKVKHVRSKHRYTELLIKDLRVRTLGELREDGVFDEPVEQAS